MREHTPRLLLAATCLLGPFGAVACGHPAPARPTLANTTSKAPVITLPIVGPPSGVNAPRRASVVPVRSVSVALGQTFSIVVSRSDGPLAWRLTKGGISPALAGAGHSAVGSCPPDSAGCAVPERYTYLARAAGKTTMVWTEESAVCASPSASGEEGSCAIAIAKVRVTVS